MFPRPSDVRGVVTSIHSQNAVTPCDASMKVSVNVLPIPSRGHKRTLLALRLFNYFTVPIVYSITDLKTQKVHLHVPLKVQVG